MITRADIQLVRSLADKRARTETGLFVAEGAKLVGEIAASSLRVRNIYSSREFAHPAFEHATAKELERLSLLKTPSDTVAVVEIPHYKFDLTEAERGLVLALDEVQNPGNMGTIIRLADWFGIRHIYCSPNTADAFSPKVIQATMGAIARVNVHYTPLPDLIQSLGDTPIYGTFLDGDSIYKQSLSEHGLIVMGNEGNGISQPVAALINRKLLIPNYPEGCATSESLNVAIATAVVCAEFRRTASSK